MNMRLRKFKTLFLTVSVLITVCVVFILMGSKDLQSIERTGKDGNGLQFDIEKLEMELKEQRDSMHKIRVSIDNFINANDVKKPFTETETKKLKPKLENGKETLLERQESKTALTWNQTYGKISEEDCPFAQTTSKSPDLQMLDVYRQLKFDNPDGGVWKQGWEVSYDSSTWSEDNVLQVFVVPHSHNDPGWIKTFEKYHQDQTRYILNGMVKKISEDLQRKFIWAEISYLDLWWQEASVQQKALFKKLVHSGQIEIVTGGWVMTDEANAHYFGITEQLIEGHEWMVNHLEKKPNNGWSIDPFGYSPAMAYILKRSGLENMVIQRAHYAIKKAFARQKSLEFRWRQVWDKSDSTDIFCHLMPFYSYDIPHTCGPDPKVCCQFDFQRMRGTGLSCPWRIQPQPITDTNVAEKADLLLDQYRKKAMLYQSNVLMVPLGDDFRYTSDLEYENQFSNYKRLFDYMNSRSDWHVKAQFGTLQDYFQALHKTMPSSIPSLSGDFFTYADINQDYWSGYFSSRPFYKLMNRVLENYLRTAEITFSLIWTHMESIGVSFPVMAQDLTKQLVYARRQLGLFQHHDAIAGTSKDHVVVDYAVKMLNAIQNSQHVIQQSAHYLLSPDKSNYKPDSKANYFDLDDVREKYNSLPQKTLVRLEKEAGEKTKVFFFNSLPHRRQELVTLRVSLWNVLVMDVGGNQLNVQLNPVFVGEAEVSEEEFDLSFLVDIPALSFTSLTIEPFQGDATQNTYLSVAFITIRSANTARHIPKPFRELLIAKELQPFTFSNLYIQASFNQKGMLESVTQLGDHHKTNIRVDFIRYATKKSGVYLFQPLGEGYPLDISETLVRVVQGSLKSEVEVHLPYLVHKVTLKHSPGVDGVGLEIVNNVDLTRDSNVEISMRLLTDLKTEGACYTDMNGLHMLRREHRDQLPIQANYYPMSSMAYVEDNSARVTLVTGQPLGVASLADGQLEVMLDRRATADDNRGAGQGMLDNVPHTPNLFRLLVEKRKLNCADSQIRPDSYPSLTGHRMSHALLYPLTHLLPEPSLDTSKLLSLLQPSGADLGADLHLVNLRTKLAPVAEECTPANEVMLILHRVGADCCFASPGIHGSSQGGTFSVKDLFPDYFGDKVQQISLTGLHKGSTIEKQFVIALQPMELYSFLLQR